jgi:hypothetical protein
MPASIVIHHKTNSDQQQNEALQATYDSQVGSPAKPPIEQIGQIFSDQLAQSPNAHHLSLEHPSGAETFIEGDVTNSILSSQH